MKVRVRMFAALREVVGANELELELPPGATVEDLWNRMASEDERLWPFGPSINFALNHDFVARDTELSPGDEVAFLPPVSGG